jgi:dTDP-4-amino-4,6-dideoxygalactose transaminase
MKVGRTLPPAAAPLGWRDIWKGLSGSCAPARARRAREAEIRREFGVRHVFLLCSGSAALALALKALKSGSTRTEVVVPAYTCFSMPAAILEAGLQPVPCDIDPVTFDFNATLLRQTLTERTLCVVGHHLFGIPSDMARLRGICDAHGTFLIEDAAQAMGVERGGRKLGTMGDIGIFSLGRGKNITCGSGGILVTNARGIADAVAHEYSQLPSPRAWRAAPELIQLALMTMFVRPRLYWIPAALPFLHLGETIFPDHVPIERLSGMKAGLLRGWQARLTASNRQRSETARFFSHRLPLRLASGAKHPYLRLPFRVKNATEKQRLYALSRARGLGLSAAYPAPIDEIPGVPVETHGRHFPMARRVAASLVTIPTHHLVSERDKTAIAELCRDFRGLQ